MQGIISAIFPGIAAMGNLHPLFVHFPIALLSAFVLTEILGAVFRCDQLRSAATWMLYLGTLGAVAAVIAGFIGAGKVPHTDEVHEILEKHEHIGLVVLSLAVFLSAWRTLVGARFSCKSQLVHILIGALMAVVMAFGADLGGLMVYKYGVATELAESKEGHVLGAEGGTVEKSAGGELTEGSDTGKSKGHSHKNGGHSHQTTQ